jgi:hypothetical protein
MINHRCGVLTAALISLALGIGRAGADPALTAAPPVEADARELQAAPAASLQPAERRVAGIRVPPGALNVVSMTTDENVLLRERVEALRARTGNGVVISRLAAVIYRLPGVVPPQRVMGFYAQELGRELADRSRAPGGEGVRSLPGGQGFLSITVGIDPERPQDSRAVVVRAEGSPAVSRLLKQLTEIVVAVAAAPAIDRATAALAPRPPLAPLPVFPDSRPEVVSRLNAGEIQLLIQNLARSNYSDDLRRRLTSLLEEAHAVSLSVYRLPRQVPGQDVIAFYSTQLARIGAKEKIRDTMDPNRPLLVYELADDGGILMVRAYPQQTPLREFSRHIIPSPFSTVISLLRVEGATELHPVPPPVRPSPPADSPAARP